jgi:hypothetical protein
MIVGKITVEQRNGSMMKVATEGKGKLTRGKALV